MNDQILDVLLFIIVKLLLIVGFIALVKFSIRKNPRKDNIPMIVYWILGLFFVLMQSYGIFRTALTLVLYDPNNTVLDLDGLNSLGAILGIIFYIYIGRNYLKKEVVKARYNE